jgi:hypothetical protein
VGYGSVSKSQVSRLAGELDGLVEAFRTRPLDGSPYPLVMLDALVLKVREQGRIVNVCVVHATGVSPQYRLCVPRAEIVLATIWPQSANRLPCTSDKISSEQGVRVKRTTRLELATLSLGS